MERPGIKDHACCQCPQGIVQISCNLWLQILGGQVLLGNSLLLHQFQQPMAEPDGNITIHGVFMK
jgi:hypothetical protein